MKDVGAEWLLFIYTKTLILVAQTDPVSFHTLVRKFLRMGHCPTQLFFCFSHIHHRISLKTQSNVPGWPTSLLAGLAWLPEGDMPSTPACFCSPSWLKLRGILTGLCLLGEVGYDEHWLPSELTDSVTQNACALPLRWETGYPGQSFPVNQHILFCALLSNSSVWDSSQIKNPCSSS